MLPGMKSKKKQKVSFIFLKIIIILPCPSWKGVWSFQQQRDSGAKPTYLSNQGQAKSKRVNWIQEFSNSLDKVTRTYIHKLGKIYVHIYLAHTSHKTVIAFVCMYISVVYMQVYICVDTCACVFTTVEAQGWCQMPSSMHSILHIEVGSLSRGGALFGSFNVALFHMECL